MWKYIIIGAVVLFLFAVYVFSKNHEALVASGGEIAALQTRVQEAIKKNKEIYIDKTTKEYAVMRTEWFQEEKTRLEREKEDLDDQTTKLKEETADLKTKYELLAGRVEKNENQMKEVLTGVAELLNLDTDMEEDEFFEVAKAKVTELTQNNLGLEKDIAMEEATITALNRQIENYLARSEAARKLNKDRQARISPAELECHVITSDKRWDYVILDAGINKGIVIGSRLAVMRGDRKICELNVTLVETSRSCCDIVYETMMTGESVEVGDRVISVRNKK